MGRVYLVGGGPGDIGLLTVKGRQCIQEADCIVYDRLINPRMLEEAKPTCDLVYVGKENRHHTMKQEDINQLLVEKSKLYECVVRLKGGDVYVFGRGGEEGLYLREHHVNFEVVPGISSSIAGLAYAGIPITHRGIATGFHVISAHNRFDELSDINFYELAQSSDTCVFLMGLTKLEEIVERLLTAGKSPQCPIAIIANATLPTQQVVTSTLSKIISLRHEHPLPSPALIVVGEVVTLRDQLNFFEELPLFHKRIIIPRVGNQPSKLARMLEGKGAEVKEFQVSKLVEHCDVLATIHYQSYQYIILNSRNAVHFFMHSLKKNKMDVRVLHHIKFAVVGDATKEALESYGIYATYCPTYFAGEDLCALLMKEVKPGSSILIPKVKGNEELWKPLETIAQVTILPLYENIKVDHPMEFVNDNVDAIVFTCSSSVINTLSQHEIPRNISIFSIGKKTSETLRAYGFCNIIEASQANYASLVETIVEKEGKIDV